MDAETERFDEVDGRIYQAIKTHTPKHDYELRLSKGELLTNVKNLSNDANWAKGTSLGQQKTGLFPLAAVREYKRKKANKLKVGGNEIQKPLKQIEEDQRPTSSKCNHRSANRGSIAVHFRSPNKPHVKMNQAPKLKGTNSLNTEDPQKLDSAYLHMGDVASIPVKICTGHKVSYVNEGHAETDVNSYVTGPEGCLDHTQDARESAASMPLARNSTFGDFGDENSQVSSDVTEKAALDTIAPVHCTSYPDPYINVKQVDPDQVREREQIKELQDNSTPQSSRKRSTERRDQATPRHLSKRQVLQATKTPLQMLNKKLIRSPRGKHRKFKSFTGALVGGLLGAVLYLACYYAIGYSLVISCIIAGLSTIFMSVGFAISVHCRCIALLMIPGLCTTRGRAATLSIIMTLLLNGPITNIFENGEQTSQIVTCTASKLQEQAELMQKCVEEQIEAITEEFRETLKKTFDTINKTKNKLREQYKSIAQTLSTIKSSLGFLAYFLPKTNTPHIPEEIKKQFEFSAELSASFGLSTNSSKDPQEVERAIKSELKRATDYAAQFSTLLTKLMSFAVLLLFFQSYWYLKQYLQNDKFDNLYITKGFKALDEKRKQKQSREIILPLKKKEAKYLIDTTAICLSPAEKWKFAQGLVLLLVHCLLAGIIQFFDFALFWLLSKIQKHGRVDFDIGFPYNLTSKISGEGAVANGLKEEWPTTDTSRNTSFINISTAECLPNPSPPNYNVLYGILAIYTFALFITLLQAYGLRLRHKIVAFFYPERERARVVILYNKLLKKRQSLRAVFRQKLKGENEPDLSKKNIKVMQVLAEKVPCLKRLAHKKYCLSCDTLCDDTCTICDTPHCTGVYCPECYGDLDYCCPLCDDTVIIENQISEDELNLGGGDNQQKEAHMIL
ncbi:DC-STAMP domain-containing protein 2 [Lingula anatina]|uniref:DC-STAMP domain-containing protein 2 n=1 Tax=Lingula anatina TaxID=7574 RepID=A0A1S3IFN8_LINAN|nr:DC-STAMP domain-containing protein 2 [Lingula anatina]|eukprot:XP_013397042.1 DC-STAMP domain-containing protein 2 [Lingula anatina]